jgi:hypothetical protein
MRYSKTLVIASCVLSLFCFPRTNRGATFYTATTSQDENAAIWTNDPVAAASLTQQLVGHGAVPSPGNDYVLLYNGTNIDNANLNLMTYVRSQNLNAFLGDSLTVNSNTDVRFKSNNIGGGNVTFTNSTTAGAPGLILAGGMIDNGDASSALNPFRVNGAIKAAPGTLSYICTGRNGWNQVVTSQRELYFTATFTGSGDLMITGSKSTWTNVTIASTSPNTFSGHWIIEGGWVQFLTPGSFGTNASIIVDWNYPTPLPWTQSGPTSVRFEPGYDINTAGTLVLTNTAGNNNPVTPMMTLHQNVIFSGVTINGTPLASGTHAYAELTNSFPGVFDPDGRGSITVQSYGPPPKHLPVIQQQPLSEELFSGGSANFIVNAYDPLMGQLIYQWQTNGVNINTGGNISGATSANLIIANASAANQFNYSVILSNADGSITSSVVTITFVTPSGETYEHAVLTNNPVAFYELNETADPAGGSAPAFDFVGGNTGLYGTGVQNGNASYNIAGPTPSVGFPGFLANNKAAAFVNGNGVSRITVLPPLNLNTNTVTICAWIYPNGPQANYEGLVFCHGSNTLAGLNYTAFTDANGNHTLGYTWNTNVWNSQLVPPTNQWSFVALVVSPTNATIYVISTNSLLSASRVFSHVNQAFDGTTLIGDDGADNGNGGRVFNGKIDDVALFKSSLSRSQILSLYTAASGVSAFAPVIAVQPASETLYAGQTAQFAVVADGNGPPSYQWRTNGVNLTDGVKISGSGTAALTISNVAAANAGNYTVIITNSSGSITSSVVTLSVLPLAGGYSSVVMAAQPVAFYELNETNDPASGGVTAFDYAGGHNGIYGIGVLNGYANYAIAGPTPAAGISWFPANNTAAYFSYNTASGQITLPPLNLNTNTVTISAWIYPDAGQVARAGLVFCRGGNTVAGLNFSATLLGSYYPLGYNWNNDPATTGWNSGLVPPISQWSYVSLVVTPTNATIYLINANGITSATHVYNHPVLAFDGPTLIGDDSADGGNGTREFGGTIDDVAIFNSALSQLQVQNVYGGPAFAPVILSSTTNLTLYAGQPANFSVAVSGSVPFSYHWRTNGINLTDGGSISGSTTSNLNISSLVAGNAGNYTVVITNYGGSVTSSVATLTVIPASGYAAAMLADQPVAFYEFNETTDPASGSAIAYDYAGGNNGLYGTHVQNGNANYNIAGPTPSAGFPQFPSNNKAAAFTNGNGGSGSSAVPPWAVELPPINLNTNTVTFAAWIYPYGPQVTSAGLIFARDQAGGKSIQGGFIYGNASGTNGYSAGLGCNWNGNDTSWHPGLLPPINQWSLAVLVVTPTNDTIYLLNTNGPSVANFASVHADYLNIAGVGNTNLFIGQDPLVFPAPPATNAASRIFYGAMDDVALFGDSLSQSQVLSLYAAGSGITYSPPTITTQPNSQTNSVGQTAQFTVAASGLPAPVYQWRTNGVNIADGANVTGSTTTSLVISNLIAANAGNYTVVVSNGLASVTSTVATLTVVTTPPVVYLTNQLSGTSMVLSWPQGTLLQATNLTGPWVTNTATSPYTLSPTNPMMFYRIRVQ